MAQPVSIPMKGPSAPEPLKVAKVHASYEPKVGYAPFEVILDQNNNVMTHPGDNIFDLRETANMTPDEVRSLADSIDQRALQNAPKEILDAIESGEISHIFRTNSNTYDSSGNQVGSIYFRKQDGSTARWKLPELSMGHDIGWNANQGYPVFSSNTAFFDPDADYGVGEFREGEAFRKQLDKGTLDTTRIPSGVDPLKINPVESILKGEQDIEVLVRESSGGPKIPSVKHVPFGPNAGSSQTNPGPAQAAPAPAPGPSPAPATASPPPSGPVGRPVNTATINATGAPRTVVSGGATGVPVTPSQAPTPPPTSGSPAAAVVTQRTPTPGGTGGATARPSTGAPGGRSSRSMWQAARDASSRVASGTKGVKALKAAGAGMILGIGAGAISRRDISVDEEEIMRLEMQRRGM